MKKLIYFLLFFPIYAHAENFRYRNVLNFGPANSNVHFEVLKCVYTANGTVCLNGEELKVDNRVYKLSKTYEPNVFQSGKAVIHLVYVNNTLSQLKITEGPNETVYYLRKQ